MEARSDWDTVITVTYRNASPGDWNEIKGWVRATSMDDHSIL